MRVLVVVALAGCFAETDRVAALDKRVAALETKNAELVKAREELDQKVVALEQRDMELGVTVYNLEHPPLAPPPPPSPPPPPPRAGLDRNKAYPVLLDDSPAFGVKTAAVTLVAAVQFPEPYTHKAWPTIEQIQHDYGNDLRLVVKSFVVHPQATESTIAACAAARQSQLHAMEDAIWTASDLSAQRHWLDAGELRDLARMLRLDMRDYDADVAGPCRAGATRDQQMFSLLGQGAVPVFWINGRPLSGAMPIDQFRTVIDEELAKSKADRAKGGKPATYYDRVTKP